MISARRAVLLVILAVGLAVLPKTAAAAPVSLSGHMPAPAAWVAWKARFVTPEGRVIDDANGSVSHSEGQGYGLVLAVAADDREAFARIWAWTRTELMLRDDGLAAWRWQPDARPHVRDRNNATDGDLLIAWALIEAGEAWNDPAFALAGRRIARALVAVTGIATRLGPVLLPGAVGFGPREVADGPLVDPSYLIFPAYERLARAMPELGWAELRAAGDRLIGEARFGPADLPPDWLSLGGDRPAPAAGRPAVFGWDALRVPLHLAWAETMPRERLAPWFGRWGTAAGDPRVVDLTSGRDLAPFGEPGYRAIPALVACALDGTRWPDELRTSADESYYPATLRLLALVAMSMRHPTCW
jgi:endoglucanase